MLQGRKIIRRKREIFVGLVVSSPAGAKEEAVCVLWSTEGVSSSSCEQKRENDNIACGCSIVCVLFCDFI